MDQGVAVMALWAASRLDDMSLAWKMLDQIHGSPLGLSCLLEACEQVGDWRGECRILWDLQEAGCSNMHGAVVNALWLQMLSLGGCAEAVVRLTHRPEPAGPMDEVSSFILGRRIGNAADIGDGFIGNTMVRRVESDQADGVGGVITQVDG